MLLVRHVLGQAVGWVVVMKVVGWTGVQEQEAADNIVKRHQDLHIHSHRAQVVDDMAEKKDHAGHIPAAVHSSVDTAVDMVAGIGDNRTKKGRIGFASLQSRYLGTGRTSDPSPSTPCLS